MDVETVFRATFGIKKEQDIVGLIEAAVNVAALIDPDKLKKHRSRIVKLLFDEDPLNSTDDLFSDDELGFNEDDGDKLIDRPKVAVSSPPPPKKEEIKKGFKKAVELMSEKIVGRQDNSMELKILGHEKDEAEKKGKRKIECMDFREPPKKHYCGGRNKVKPPGGGDVRRRLLARMKAQHAW